MEYCPGLNSEGVHTAIHAVDGPDRPRSSRSCKWLAIGKSESHPALSLLRLKQAGPEPNGQTTSTWYFCQLVYAALHAMPAVP